MKEMIDVSMIKSDFLTYCNLVIKLDKKNMTG